MVVVAHEVAQLTKNFALLNPLRRVEHYCRVYLILFVGFERFKTEASDAFILQYSPLKSNSDARNVQVFISDVDKFVDALVGVLTLAILHRQQEDEPCLTKGDFLFELNLTQRLSGLIYSKNIPVGLDQINIQQLMDYLNLMNL